MLERWILLILEILISSKLFEGWITKMMRWGHWLKIGSADKFGSPSHPSWGTTATAEMRTLFVRLRMLFPWSRIIICSWQIWAWNYGLGRSTLIWVSVLRAVVKFLKLIFDIVWVESVVSWKETFRGQKKKGIRTQVSHPTFYQQLQYQKLDSRRYLFIKKQLNTVEQVIFDLLPLVVFERQLVHLEYGQLARLR